jgi:hypothetical protein
LEARSRKCDRLRVRVVVGGEGVQDCDLKALEMESGMVMRSMIQV